MNIRKLNNIERFYRKMRERQSDHAQMIDYNQTILVLISKGRKIPCPHNRIIPDFVNEIVKPFRSCQMQNTKREGERERERV